MPQITLKEAVCQLYNIDESEFREFVMRRTLFRRVRLLRPVLSIFNPDLLFQEKRLVDKIGEALSLREIQEEIDFYQHKYVVNFVCKDALKFRLSGMRLMILANKAFKETRGSRIQGPALAG